MNHTETEADTPADRIAAIVPAQLREFRRQLCAMKKRHVGPKQTFSIDSTADRSVGSYKKYARRLQNQGDISRTYNRNSLRQLAESTTENNIEYTCAAILAWGGMSVPNFNRLFSSEDKQKWIDVALEVKFDDLSRSKAFSRFADLRAKKGTGKTGSMLPGVGPAYFTKLIHFLAPDKGDRPEAHILDQWAGWSINALWNERIVLMDETFNWKGNRAAGNLVLTPSLRVSDANTSDEYENFCSKVDQLIVQLGDELSFEGFRASDLIDRTFMFEKRMKSGTWRNHLVNKHKQPWF